MGDERDAVAALAHALRSPLAVVELYSGMLEAKGASLSDEQREEYVARIRRAVDEMRATMDRAAAR